MQLLPLSDNISNWEPSALGLYLGGYQYQAHSLMHAAMNRMTSVENRVARRRKELPGISVIVLTVSTDQY